MSFGPKIRKRKNEKPLSLKQTCMQLQFGEDWWTNNSLKIQLKVSDYKNRTL